MKGESVEQTKEVRKSHYRLLLLSGLGLGAWWVLQVVWSAFSGLNKEIAASLVAGTLVAAGAIWGKYMERRHSVEAQFRDAKVALFNEFMKALDQAVDGSKSPDEFTSMLKEWKRKLLFWGGPKVMARYLSLGERLGHVNTVQEMALSTQAMGDLILAMRKDIGLSNRGIITGTTMGIPRGTIFGARYLMRYPNFFLDHLRKCPTMTMDELTALEKKNARPSS